MIPLGEEEEFDQFSVPVLSHKDGVYEKCCVTEVRSVLSPPCWLLLLGQTGIISVPLGSDYVQFWSPW